MGQRTSLSFYINTRFQSVPGRQKRGFEAMREGKKNKKKKSTVLDNKSYSSAREGERWVRERVVVEGCLLQ